MIEFLKRLFGKKSEKVKQEWVVQDNTPFTNNEQTMESEQEQEKKKPVNNPQDNIKAFLDMIAFAEGTIDLGDDGYNVIVGGRLFDQYDDHPRVLVDLPRLGIKSTAAGRYQILSRYWDHYKAQLRLPDFGPNSQDRYAIQQIKERRALTDVREGRISAAVDKCKNIWASFPNSPYGQRTIDMKTMLNKYVELGGSLCERDQEKL